MRWRKIYEGVYEGEPFKPEPVGPGPIGEFPSRKEDEPDRLHHRLRATVPNAKLCWTYNYHFTREWSQSYHVAEHWHVDGAHDGSDHVLLLICCDNPALGTQIKQADGRVITCKTWTPYLMRWDTQHASPRGPWSCDRRMYRQFVKLNEKDLLLAVDKPTDCA